MEETARIISRAFTNCIMDRYAHAVHYYTGHGLSILQTVTIRRVAQVGCLLRRRAHFEMLLPRMSAFYGFHLTDLTASDLVGKTSIASEKHSTGHRCQPRRPASVGISEVASGTLSPSVMWRNSLL